MPDPNYFAIGCYNNGGGFYGFHVFEVSADKKSGTFKSFVTLNPMTAIVSTPDALTINRDRGGMQYTFTEVTFTGTTYTTGTVRDVTTSTL